MPNCDRSQYLITCRSAVKSSSSILFTPSNNKRLSLVKNRSANSSTTNPQPSRKTIPRWSEILHIVILRTSLHLLGACTCLSTVMMKNSMEKHSRYPEWRPCQTVRKRSVVTWDRVLLPRNFNLLKTCLQTEKRKSYGLFLWLQSRWGQSGSFVHHCPQVKHSLTWKLLLHSNWGYIKTFQQLSIPSSSRVLMYSMLASVEGLSTQKAWNLCFSHTAWARRVVKSGSDKVHEAPRLTSLLQYAKCSSDIKHHKT